MMRLLQYLSYPSELEVLMTKIFFLTFFFAILLLSYPVQAGVDVIEGEEAKVLYEEQKDSAETLSQINKIFVLKKPGGENIENPPEVSAPVGSYLFIVNDEEKTVHNVYDQTDHSWVLKKQLPAGIAALKFTEPGIHELRCAIHPGMKVTIKVIEKTD
jgi:plastocyanin